MESTFTTAIDPAFASFPRGRSESAAGARHRAEHEGREPSWAKVGFRHPRRSVLRDTIAAGQLQRQKQRAAQREHAQRFGAGR